MPEHFEICVIGSGAAGASAAFALSQRAHKVALVEQFNFVHNRGSSHGKSRIFRYSYEYPEYVAMAIRARELWNATEQRSGKSLLAPTGGLDLGKETDPTIEARYVNLVAAGAKPVRLTAEQCGHRYPQFKLERDSVAIFDEHAGILDADLCIRTFIELAKDYGADLFSEERVMSLDPGSQAIKIQTNKRTFLADRVVISTGAWTNDLLQTTGLKLKLRVTKEQVLYFKAQAIEEFKKGKFPIFIHFGFEPTNGPPQIIYGFPAHELPAVKVASHQTGPETTGDSRNFDIEEDGKFVVQEYISHHLPGLTQQIADSTTCLYTNTADEHFVLDYHPADRRIVVASPCSGHGFKFAPLTGNLIADLIEEKSPEFDLNLFKINRSPLH